jgi:drug/metabolite transporter (DMT)-like permease
VPHADSSRTRVLTALFAVYLFWGSSYLAARIGVRALPAFLYGGTRFITAGTVMLLIAALLKQRVRPLGREWRDLLVLALIGFVICNGAGVWSLQYVASNQAALLNASAPCWIALLGTLGVRAHRPTTRAVVGLVLGFAGTALLLAPAATGTKGALLPQLVVLGGCLAWAASSIYLRNAGVRLGVLALIGWQMLLGGIGLALIGLASGELARWQWNTRGAVSLAFQLVFASCIAHTAYAWLATRVTPTTLGTYGYVNPAVATALGWWWLGESLVPAQLLGMTLALASVALITWRPRGLRAAESSH